MKGEPKYIIFFHPFHHYILYLCLCLIEAVILIQTLFLRSKVGELSIEISNFKSILSFSKIEGIDTDVEILNGQMTMR